MSLDWSLTELRGGRNISWRRVKDNYLHYDRSVETLSISDGLQRVRGVGINLAAPPRLA